MSDTLVPFARRFSELELPTRSVMTILEGHEDYERMFSIRFEGFILKMQNSANVLGMILGIKLKTPAPRRIHRN